MADLARAKRAIKPARRAAVVITEFGGHPGDLDAVAALAVQLQIDMNAIKKNDLRGCEAMLHSQAHALQAIFVDLSLQAAKQEWFPNVESLMRLAMKAQSQCRTTVETLAAIKNPPVVFARQANIAQGPQQVNNGLMPSGEPRAGAGGTERLHNELSGGSNELLPDTRMPGSAVGSDPAMAAVGTFDGAEDTTR
jgi:hypothetical protein